MRWHEAKLLDAVRSGDPDAWSALVGHHYRIVYRFLRGMTGESELAADLTQDTFVSAWLHVGGFRGAASISTWLHRIAINACRQQMRKKHQTEAACDSDDLPQAVGDADDLSAQVTSCDRAEVVRAAVRALPEDLQMVISLHYGQKMSQWEVAEALAVPLGTVKRRLGAALGNLRCALSQSEEAHA